MGNLAPMSPDEARDELATINAVMAAAREAFAPRGDRDLTVRDVVVTCAGLVAFLREAEQTPRTLGQWQTAIERLRITLGSARTPPAEPDA